MWIPNFHRKTFGFQRQFFGREWERREAQPSRKVGRQVNISKIACRSFCFLSFSMMMIEWFVMIDLYIWKQWKFKAKKEKIVNTKNYNSLDRTMNRSEKKMQVLGIPVSYLKTNKQISPVLLWEWQKLNTWSKHLVMSNVARMGTMRYSVMFVSYRRNHQANRRRCLTCSAFQDMTTRTAWRCNFMANLRIFSEELVGILH